MKVGTCRTEECTNGDIPITLDFLPPDDPDIKVVCGVCENEITDIVEE